jgi:hypothetical protein
LECIILYQSVSLKEKPGAALRFACGVAEGDASAAKVTCQRAPRWWRGGDLPFDENKRAGGVLQEK